jgi:hypothetical protein
MIARFARRVVAGITGAALTAALAGLVISIYDLTTTGPSGFGEDVADGILTFVLMATIYGTILGAPFGILVMCMTRAKTVPWRALPTLLIGTSSGIILLGLPWLVIPGLADFPAIGYGMCVMGPFIGGLIASNFLPISEPSTL